MYQCISLYSFAPVRVCFAALSKRRSEYHSIKAKMASPRSPLCSSFIFARQAPALHSRRVRLYPTTEMPAIISQTNCPPRTSRSSENANNDLRVRKPSRHQAKPPQVVTLLMEWTHDTNAGPIARAMHSKVCDSPNNAPSESLSGAAAFTRIIVDLKSISGNLLVISSSLLGTHGNDMHAATFARRQSNVTPVHKSPKLSGSSWCSVPVLVTRLIIE